MEKSVRKAVRVLLIKENNILVIKYKSNKNKDYYDIPGGKIEQDETPEDAAIREFKEETGICIYNPYKIGHVLIEYPNMVFDIDLYKVEEFDGILQDFEDNYSMWINKHDLFAQNKILPTIEIIKHIEDNKSLRIVSDKNHNIIKIYEC